MPKCIEVCPFDGLPCTYGSDFVSSCDDALSLATDFDWVEDESCSRAVYPVGKKK